MENQHKKKRFSVMLDGREIAKTWAVSAEKAINNVRWNYFISKRDYRYDMSDFDAIEL